jgi:hypothetical protein
VQIATIDPVRVASTVPVEAVLTDPAEATALVIWTARLRIDHVENFRASASRTFNAAASIDPAVDLAGPAGIDSVAVEVLAAVDSADLAASAAAVDSGADDSN